MKNKFFKKIMAVVVVAMAVILLFAGCKSGSGDTDSTKGPKQTSTPVPAVQKDLADKEGYYLSKNGSDIYLGEDFAKYKDALGDALNYFEAPSCAFEGMDKIYYYSGFAIYTFPDGDIDRVLSIVLSDDLTKTNEGIFIGSAKDDVVAKYGEVSRDTDSSLIYEKSKTKLIFILNSDMVSSIQYYFDE